MKSSHHGLLRSVIEARVAATAKYARKERVREALQSIIVDQVASGAIGDDASLADLFATFTMALNALKGVPFEVWSKLAKRA